MSLLAERTPLIVIRELTKSFSMGTGAIHALARVNLNVYSGDSLAIMGPSGSGKSTLMHLLGCLDSPTSGSYFFDGEDVSHLSDEELASIRASKIGFVFQSFNLIPQLTVTENVELPFLYQSQKAENYKERAKDALIRVGLSHRLHHSPALLSGGEMQRVAIARALAINPLLILADEPTGNLDSENGRAILNLFSALGKTLIIVTHDRFVAEHCQRIVRMQDGYLFEER